MFEQCLCGQMHVRQFSPFVDSLHSLVTPSIHLSLFRPGGEFVSTVFGIWPVTVQKRLTLWSQPRKLSWLLRRPITKDFGLRKFVKRPRLNIHYAQILHWNTESWRLHKKHGTQYRSNKDRSGKLFNLGRYHLILRSSETSISTPHVRVEMVCNRYSEYFSWIR